MPSDPEEDMSNTRKCSTGSIMPAECHPCRRQLRSLSFVDLPAEIRNKIYDLLFAGYVLLYRSHPVRERFENPHVKTRLYLACRRIYSWPAGTHFYIAPGVLRVCRQVHDEAIAFLYGNTTFRLESVFTVNKFLNIVPAADAIRKLELRHSTYGEPRLTEDRKWKHRHDKKWMNTCRRIAKNMTSLEHLKIELRICDWPTQLNLVAPWAKPLLVLKGSTGIHHVEVTLIHDAFNEQRLQAAANVVARAMRTGESRFRPELAGNVADIEPIKLSGDHQTERFPKATKVLITRPPPSQITNDNPSRRMLDGGEANSTGPPVSQPPFGICS
jgi:hypothetical protein